MLGSIAPLNHLWHCNESGRIFIK